MNYHREKPYIIGIDPGSASGAIAFYDYHCKMLFKVMDMPTRTKKTKVRGKVKVKGVIKIKNKTKVKTEINIPELAMTIDMYSPKILLAVIEDVHSMPKQGVVGIFSFGKAYGTILGILNAYYIPIFTVKPAVWKGLMNVTSNKMTSLSKAQELFPDFKHLWSNEDSHNMAEAALLASLGERFVLDEDKLTKGTKSP